MKITDKSIKLRVVSALFILLSLAALSLHYLAPSANYLAPSANVHRTATSIRSALPRNGPADVIGKARLNEAYGKLPLSFEANDGRAIGWQSGAVSFLARGEGYDIHLTPNEAVIELRNEGSLANKTPLAAPLRMRLVGAAASPQVEGLDELPGKSHYFTGADPRKWRIGVRHYARVRYQNVYPGVNLVYYGNQRQLEYDFIVAPGADPQAIRIEFNGAEQLALDAEGELVLRTAGGELRQHKPIVYQETGSDRELIEGRYVIHTDKEVGFALGAYDASRPLVIDPALAYSSYLGGSGSDLVNAVAVDAAGNLYVTGQTASTNFPSVSPAQQAYGGATDVFVTKLNAAGTAMIYSTYIGGAAFDSGGAIAVDAAGAVYLTGQTSSNNFPTVNPLPQSSGANGDAFVTKLKADGSALIYSTYLGGNEVDIGRAIAPDADGNAYVTGGTGSTNFPTTPGALRAAFSGPAGSLDFFYTKLNAAGSSLVYSTYLGGNGFEEGRAISVDASGVYLLGSTSSTNWPVTAGAAQGTYGGGAFDAVVAKFNAAGTALLYSTYLGGNGDDRGRGLAIDAAGQVYATGLTGSTNFPTANPLQPAFGGGVCGAAPCTDAFVAKLNAAGTAFLYSTYLGGAGNEHGLGIALDSSRNAYVTGITQSANFPIANSLQPALRGTSDAFVAKLDAAGATLVYSTYHGGTGTDAGLGITVDAAGNAYAAGQTASTNLPTANPLQPTNGGGALDAFIAKLGADARNTTIATRSAASFDVTAASESIVTSFGAGLGTTSLAASAVPLPTSLDGTSVKVKDSSGMERLASLLFVSPNQINFQIPAGTTVGTATVTVNNNGAATNLGTVSVAGVAPGIFTANSNGRGVPVALALRVQPGAVQSYEPVAVFDAAQNRFVARPLDLGPETDQVFLVLFCTGLRFRSTLAAVTINIGGVNAQVVYAGIQPDLVGLDQVNVRLPRSLIGRGNVDVTLIVDGQMANVVGVNFK